MDSQEQYEALLKAWGYEDNSVARQKRRKQIKALVNKISALFREAIKGIQQLQHKYSHSA